MAADLSFLDSSDPADLDLACRVDSLCDEFESCWKSGNRPDLSRYLQGTDLPLETLFAELVQIDIAYRARQGEQPTLAEYASRYPNLKNSLLGMTLPVEMVTEQVDQISVEYFPCGRVGKFGLEEKLGEGTFAIVWKAFDTRLKRTVALKQFHERFADMTSRLLQREARAVAQVDHPHVVRVHEIYEYQQVVYAAFEFVSGGTLADWITNRRENNGAGPIAPAQAADLVAQIAAGLQAVHEQGVIHRDLKPTNILMDAQGVLKIADFGLARHAGVLSTIGSEGVMLGTVPYMSPEHCRGKEVTERSDLFSLGVLFYELLTGERPFQGPREELTQKIQFAAVVPPSKLTPIPPSLENICLRALEKDPRDRYASATEFLQDLQRARQGIAVPRVVPSAAVRLARAVVRNWGIALGTLLGVSGFGALAAAMMLAPDDGKLDVELNSVPPGAKVAFIPLNSATGIPLPEKIVHARGTTPIRTRLSPNDYLVEVYLEDGSGRFHEVYRRVPSDQEKLATFDPYHGWRRDKNNFHRVTLPKVTLPENSVKESMVLVPGSASFTAGRGDNSPFPAHARTVPAFYMDPTEVPLAAYQETFQRHGDPDRRWVDPPTSQHALTTKWPMAVFLLERLGKRLPDEFEYEMAATKNGTREYSWGDTLPPAAAEETEFQPVGFPQFDRVDFERPIFGLGSNVAEWTMSWSNAVYPPRQKLWQENVSSPGTLTLRVVRGGNKQVIDGDAAVTPELRDPRERTSLPMTAIRKGLGLRGVRSPGPRLTPEDFGRPVGTDPEPGK